MAEKNIIVYGESGLFTPDDIAYFQEAGVKARFIRAREETVSALSVLLSKETGAIVAVPGAVDIVTDGERVVGAHNGVQMMQRITATDCTVTALITAFVSLDPMNAFEATVSALSVFGLAGVIGMDQAKGPASLRVHLILYELSLIILFSKLLV